MNTGFDHAFQTTQGLVADFQANCAFYRAATYSETQARKDFIDKFLIALGWDVNNDRHPNPFEQEVKVERPVGVGATQRRADYAFFVAPNYRDARFVLEAKKPYGELATPDNYFQALRYGWSLQNQLAALTDFEHFHLLDCRYKPNIDTALHRRVEKWTLEDYCNRDSFARLYWLVSREAVTQDSLSKFVASLPKPRGKAKRRGQLPGTYKSIDDAFLEDLDGYRNDLARAFKKAQPELDSESLTESTQRTLDRLVFMRFLEDKLIEPSRFVANFGRSGTAWRDFIAASRRLDGVYNGIVFKRHALLDADDFAVDEAAFSRLCESLSHKNSPYDFNAIPIHILGSIYERFLGNVIVATGKRVSVQPKSEARKAGGVYYTPEYIVRFIVKNTVGKLIAGKTPDEIAAMRFVDIACGSGSFLLGMYDLLLTHHAAYYNAFPRKAKKGECELKDGIPHLTVEKKRSILLNNIFGVDVDPQAVEVTQLSLYLKLLDEETVASARGYQLKMHAAILPPLNENIVCGNSLIGRDMIDDPLFPAEEERKLNPLDFADAFPAIMRDGGFDAVVGNPPYVRIQGFPRRQIEYLTRRFESATGNCDLYVSFVERGYSLVKSGGRVGYILPNKFLRTDYGRGLRKLLADSGAVSEIVDFGVSQVFDATTYTCLLFLHKDSGSAVFDYAESTADPKALDAARRRASPIGSLGSEPWLLRDEATARLRAKLKAQGPRLLDLPASMSRGSSSGSDEVFMVEADAPLEPEALRVPLFATDFGRYEFNPAAKWRIIFPYVPASGKFRPLTEQELKVRFPGAYGYLRSHQAELKRRKQYADWFAYSAPRNLSLHERASIAVPLLADRGVFAMIPAAFRGKLCPMASGGFSITIGQDSPVSDKYVLGLLNSRLLFWELRQISNYFRGGWVTCTKQYFGELPIALPDSATRRKIDASVEAIIEATRDSRKAKTDKDRNFYEAKIASLDRKIDGLVYELYRLTEEEIGIVESASERAMAPAAELEPDAADD